MRCTHAEKRLFYKKTDFGKDGIKQAAKVVQDYHFEEAKRERGMRVLARRDPDTK